MINLSLNINQRINEQNKMIESARTYREIIDTATGNLKDIIITDLSELTQTSKWQVAFGWTRGNNPSKIKQEIISNYLQRPAKELFP